MCGQGWRKTSGSRYAWVCTELTLGWDALSRSHLSPIRNGSELDEVVQADYLHLGVADDGTVLAEETGCEYLLVLV